MVYLILYCRGPIFDRWLFPTASSIDGKLKLWRHLRIVLPPCTPSIAELACITHESMKHPTPHLNPEARDVKEKTYLKFKIIPHPWWLHWALRFLTWMGKAPTNNVFFESHNVFPQQASLFQLGSYKYWLFLCQCPTFLERNFFVSDVPPYLSNPSWWGHLPDTLIKHESCHNIKYRILQIMMMSRISRFLIQMIMVKIIQMISICIFRPSRATDQ